MHLSHLCKQSTEGAHGIATVLVYVVGFPVIVITLMTRFFPKRSSMSPDDRNKLDVWLGPIYLPYKPKYQAYFEIFMLLRRLILAIALSMISSSSTKQTFVVWLVLMLSAIVQLCLQPYDGVSSKRGQSGDHEQRTRITLEAIFTENVFEPMVLLVLFMSFILVRFSALDSLCAVNVLCSFGL